MPSVPYPKIQCSRCSQDVGCRPMRAKTVRDFPEVCRIEFIIVSPGPPPCRSLRFRQGKMEPRAGDEKGHGQEKTSDTSGIASVFQPSNEGFCEECEGVCFLQVCLLQTERAWGGGLEHATARWDLLGAYSRPLSEAVCSSCGRSRRWGPIGVIETRDRDPWDR